MNNNFKILIESEEDGTKIEVSGTKPNLMKALAYLSRSMLKGTNLSKEEIRRAVELGLMSDEELKEEANRKTEELKTKVEKLIKQIFD
jgi:hypothetical protein